MQKNTDNNTHDAFSELYRQKLENHTLPVDDGVWDAIQKGIAVRKRRRIIPLWWMSAAAVLVLSLLIFRFSDNELPKQLADNKTIERTAEKIVSGKQDAEIIFEKTKESKVTDKLTAQNEQRISVRPDKSENNTKIINQIADYIPENVNDESTEIAKAVIENAKADNDILQKPNNE